MARKLKLTKSCKQASPATRPIPTTRLWSPYQYNMIGLIPAVYNREYGLNAKGGRNSYCDLTHLTERFTCIRADEHQIESQEFGELIPPLACKFSKVNSHQVAVADEDGGILVFNTCKTGLHAVIQDWRAHQNAIFDIDWTPGEGKLLTASGDQTVQLWDMATEERLATFKGHSSSVKAVSYRKTDPFVFATGARDGHVMVWDSRVKSKNDYIPSINAICNAHMCQKTESASSKKRRVPKIQPDSQQSVTAVTFQDDYTLITGGSVDGSVKVWDLRKNFSILKGEPIARHILEYSGTSARKHGFSNLVLDSTRTRLFASCMDNVIYQYNCATYQSQPVACYRGHLNSSFYIKTALSPDDLYLISGSSDNNAYIWRVDEPHASPLTLKGHAGEVSVVAWCPEDLTKLVTVSDDSTIRMWRADGGCKTDDNHAMGTDVVGTAEPTHRDIGVSAGKSLHSLGSPLKVTAVTPKHHRSACLQLSPVGAVPSPVSTASPLARVIKEDLNSPPTPKSAKSLLRRTPRKTRDLNGDSPLKSPRRIHVLLSPRKVPIPGCFDALSPRKHLVSPHLQGPFPSSHSPRTGLRGIKRKLCDESPQDKMLGCKRICDNTNNPNTQRTPDGTVLLTSKENRTPGVACMKKLTFSDSFKTPEKNAAVNVQSPTVNLPNYVMNPEPRTPQPRKRTDSSKENGQAKTPNWLEQLRQKRESESVEGPVLASPRAKVQRKIETPSPTTSKQSRRSSVRKVASPRPSVGPKTPTEKRRSIMTYFSPKEPQK